MSTFPPRPRRARLAACLALALAAPLHAQHHPDTTTPTAGPQARPADATQLDTLVVTAAAPVAPLTWVTDPKQPRQPVPASDGADYLKTVPGFSAIRNGGTNGDPVLRGMFGSRLNVLSNDGTLAGACPARMDNPLSYIAPETFDHLTIVKGPQTVLWGPGASAGTIRFERDTPHFAQFGGTLDASALAGSNNRNDQALDGTLGNATGYVRFTGNRSESDDYTDGSGTTVPSRWRKWNTDAAIGWTPDADTVLEISAGRGNGLARYAGRSMDGSQFERTSYGARFEKTRIGDSWQSIKASAYSNDADHVMDNYTLRTPNPDSAMPMPMAANVDRRTQGGRVASQWQWGQVTLTAGLDAQASRHRARSASGVGAYTLVPRVRDAGFSNRGVFGEATFGTGGGQRWVAGLRLDRAQATDHRATVTDAMMMTVANPTDGQTRKQTLTSGFLRWERDIRPGWSLYAGLGHSARMPDYWELISPDSGPDGSINAFSAIQPERTTQLDLGAQYRGRTLDAWVSAYAGKVDDFILFTYTRGMMGNTTQATNVDARIAGGEAGMEWRPADGWKLGSTVAYAWGQNRTDGRALPQMPPLETRLTIDWTGRRWSAGAVYRAVARQGRVAVGQGNVVGQDIGPSAGFATFAFNGGYRFTDAVSLSAGIDNLFDRDYSEHLNLAGSADFGWPADPVRIHEPGRTWWLRLQVRG